MNNNNNVWLVGGYYFDGKIKDWEDYPLFDDPQIYSVDEALTLGFIVGSFKEWLFEYIEDNEDDFNYSYDDLIDDRVNDSLLAALICEYVYNDELATLVKFDNYDEAKRFLDEERQQLTDFYNDYEKVGIIENNNGIYIDLYERKEL